MESEGSDENVREPLLQSRLLTPMSTVSSPTHTERVGCMSTKSAMLIVFLANLLLVILKVYALIRTGSMAVLSSLTDSALDLASQLILFCVEQNANKPSENYIAGRTRLEPVGIIATAVLMAMAAVEVLREAVISLVANIKATTPFQPPLSWAAVTVLGVASVLNLFVCILTKRMNTPLMDTLREDAQNDVLSNAGALIAFGAAAANHQFWWFDQVGAILISLYIIMSWFCIAQEQTRKLAGVTASSEQIKIVRSICAEHKQMTLDILRAYHIGRLIMVEVEAIMDKSCTLETVHDECLSLQQHIETLSFVERAFVHVDYEHRGYDEHKRAVLL